MCWQRICAISNHLLTLVHDVDTVYVVPHSLEYERIFTVGISRNFAIILPRIDLGMGIAISFEFQEMKHFFAVG